MSRNNSTTKSKRTNKHSSSGRRSASDLRDQELLASAWAELRNKPRLQQRLLPGQIPRELSTMWSKSASPWVRRSTA